MLPRHPLRNALLAVVAVWPATTLTAQIRSVLLEDLTWKQAADFLTPQTIVMIPLGAAISSRVWGWRGWLMREAVAAYSTMAPRSMTAISWARPATSVRSWEIRI